jgi:outer membrane protein OmpA-like peptidoglycan-associated protein
MRTAIAIVAVGFCACAEVPKPQELAALEGLKGEGRYAAAQKRAPELVAQSDSLLAESRREWQARNVDDSRRDALMGSIKLNTAYALVDQDQAKARAKAIQAESAVAQEEYARLTKDLAGMNEQVALLKKLAGTRKELGQEQLKAAAIEKVRAAEVALRNADTVNASVHAEDDYRSASDLLARAGTELKAGDFAAASASADQARSKAEQAYLFAKPIFRQGEQNMAGKARTEALTREASAIDGATVKVDRSGGMQRLRIIMSGLFIGKSTMLAPGKEDRLEVVAGLLKKYSEYAVQVVGHTDSRGAHDQLVAVSLSRAQSVYAALVARGVDPKHALVTGQGPDDPLVPGKSSTARAQNNRVEVVFLYR